MSEATQAEYGAAESGTHGSSTHEDWLEGTEGLQRGVLTDAGVSTERMAAALYVLRAASQLFPGDAEVQHASLYVRHNRARPGTLKLGDELPDVRLYSLQQSTDGVKEHISLRAACSGAAPTLLVAGSWS